MIYEVTATIFFDIEDESKDFYHDCELAILKGTTINPGQPNAEYSIIQRNISNHDLDPNAPSVVLQYQTTGPPQP